MPSSPPPVKELLNSRTLIVGEVNTGKTKMMAELIRRFAGLEVGRLALMDMAPEVTRGVGGKMIPPAGVTLRTCLPEIVAPRLTGKTPQEVLALAQANAECIEEAFLSYLNNPAAVLFVNDVSLYLQAGDPANLYQVLRATPTVVLNGYLGTSLGGGELGARERRLMEELASRCDRVYRLA